MGKKKKKRWIPAVFGRLLRNVHHSACRRSLIFLCSLVWQLKRLKMTLSISQARIGDIEAHNHWRACIKGTYIIHKCTRAHTHTRARIHKRTPQRSFLTAVNNHPTAGSASDSEIQNILICSWDVCLFVWLTFHFKLKQKRQAGRGRSYLRGKTKHCWNYGLLQW